MDTQKAIELLEKSEHVGLLIPPHPSIDALAAAEIVARILADRGKTVGFVTAQPPTPLPAAIFKKVLASSPLSKEFIVSLDTSSSGVSQLRYEKHEDRIDIILSPKSSPVRQEFFSYHDGNLQCDCAVALGIPDIEAMDNGLAIDPRILTQTPLINIDTSSDNRRWAETNVISPDKMSLAEIVYEILQGLPGVSLSGEDATLVLAGVMASSDCFATHTVNAPSLEIASSLLTKGASWQTARDLARAPQPFALLQLASRAAVRSKQDQEHAVTWSFLTVEDFEKTGRSPGDLSFVMRHISTTFPPAVCHALLWQDPHEKSVRAVLQADAPVLEMIAGREPGRFQSPDFALEARFSGFPEAEDRIAALLKEVI